MLDIVLTKNYYPWTIYRFVKIFSVTLQHKSFKNKNNFLICLPSFFWNLFSGILSCEFWAKDLLDSLFLFFTDLHRSFLRCGIIFFKFFIQRLFFKDFQLFRSLKLCNFGKSYRYTWLLLALIQSFTLFLTNLFNLKNVKSKEVTKVYSTPADNDINLRNVSGNGHYPTEQKLYSINIYNQ